VVGINELIDNVNNNAETNILASIVLKEAAGFARRLGMTPPSSWLDAKLGQASRRDAGRLGRNRGRTNLGARQAGASIRASRRIPRNVETLRKLTDVAHMSDLVRVLRNVLGRLRARRRAVADRGHGSGGASDVRGAGD
jgi:hypothetical protein